MEGQVFMGKITVTDNDPRLPELEKDLDKLGLRVGIGDESTASKLADEIAERLNVLPVLVVQAGQRQCIEGQRPEAAMHLLGVSDLVAAIRGHLAADPDYGPDDAAVITYALMREIARQNSIGKVGAA